MDVCGLEIRDHTLTPHFWTWSWGPTDLIDLTDLLPEISAAKAVMLDGPQGLARVGCNIRASERSLAAAGKTGDKRPPLSQPYGGFVASSLDLFAAFHAAGLFDPSTQDLQLDEVYPASIWTRLARGLPNKRRRDGRQARVAILRRWASPFLMLPVTMTLTHARRHYSPRRLIGTSKDFVSLRSAIPCTGTMTRPA